VRDALVSWFDEPGRPTQLDSLQAGDEALFAELVLALSPVLLRLARSCTSNDAAAQDAVQDTWVVVIASLGSFAGRSSLKSWVCGICLHTARRRGVKESRTSPFSSLARGSGPAVDAERFASRHDAAPTGTWLLPPVRWDTQPEEHLAEAELRAAVQQSIARLPARQREVITARDVVGLDATEVAQALGLSAGNQRVLLHRARSKVRADLEVYAGSAPASPSSRRGSTSPGPPSHERLKPLPPEAVPPVELPSRPSLHEHPHAHPDAHPDARTSP
jgi:RNA polymerase sigma-70 factor (ECF subfamily)